jgi:hypothetical protein
MNSEKSLAIGIAGLVLVLWIGSSGGQAPPNPTSSDAAENTAGGTDALANNTTGFQNTAFGYNALRDNTTGVANTAIGDMALQKG